VPSSAACAGARTPGAVDYRPRRPARAVLHRIVRENLETYLTMSRRGDGQGDDFTGRVPGCGHDFLVGFSCRGRDICPSCATRRMVETAAHLVDHVLPRMPFRQWVLSVPKRVRWHLREKPPVVSDLLKVSCWRWR